MEVSQITIAVIFQALFFLLISTLWCFFSSRRLKKHIASLREISNQSTELAKKAQTKVIQLKAQLKQARGASPETVDAKQEFDYGRHIEATLLITEQRIESLKGDPKKYDATSSYALRVAILRNWYLKAELDGFHNKDNSNEFWESLGSGLTPVFKNLTEQGATDEAQSTSKVADSKFSLK